MNPLLLLLLTTSTCALSLVVQTIDGSQILLEVNANDPIEIVKVKFQDQTGILAEEPRLIFQGRELEAGRSLKDYDIKEKDVVHLREAKVNNQPFF